MEIIKYGDEFPELLVKNTKENFEEIKAVLSNPEYYVELFCEPHWEERVNRTYWYRLMYYKGKEVKDWAQDVTEVLVSEGMKNKIMDLTQEQLNGNNFKVVKGYGNREDRF